MNQSYWDWNREVPKPTKSGNIIIEHGMLKGSFTCLGNHYNLYNEQSMKRLDHVLKTVDSKSDLRMAHREIGHAKKNAETWEREPNYEFLYDGANKQGDWNTTF